MDERESRRWAALTAVETKESSALMGTRSVSIAPRAMISVLMVCLVATSCGGGGSDTSPSLSVLGASPLSPTGQTSAFINGETVDQLFVSVDFSGGFFPIDVTLTLRDAAGREIQASIGAVASSPALLGPIDATALDEGPVALEILLTDSTGSRSSLYSTTIEKDTLPPLTPAPPVVMGAPSALPTLVNSANHDEVIIQIEAGGAFVGDELVTAIFGTDPNESPTVAGSPDAGESVIALPPADLSGIADGVLNVTVVVQDPAGNTSSVVTPFLIDTTVSSVVATSVPAAGPRPQDTINLSNVGDTVIAYALTSDATSDETLFLSLSDGAQSVNLPGLPAPEGGVGTLSGVDLTVLGDGPLTMTARVEDDHGNVSPILTTALQKDTLAPGITALVLPAGPANAEGAINATTVPGVRFQVELAGDFAVGDVVDLDLTDGSATASLTVAGPGPGSFLLSPLDASPVPDGTLTATARVRDAAGNVSQDVAITVIKDTVAPAAPVSVTVPSSGLNASGFVNQATQASVTVSVDLPPALEAGADLEVTISDGASTISVTEPAPMGGGPASFPNLNLTGFGEGALSLQARLVDAIGNASPSTAGSAQLDRSLGLPTVALPPGPGQTAGYVSQASASSATITFVFPATAGSADVMTAEVSGGGVSLGIPAITLPGGGGQVTVNSFDLSTIPDGAIQISGTVTDPAGNMGTFGPVGFTKDTVAPAGLAAMSVAAGSLNPAHEVNASNVSQTILDIQWSSLVDGTEAASLTISDLGGGSLTFGPFSPPPGGGQAAVGPFDLSSLADGTLVLQAAVQDPAGNVSTSSGTPAVKITSSLGAPTSMHVAAGTSNPTDFINAVSASSVTVEVVFPSVYTGTEAVTVTLSDGTNAVTSASALVPAGGGLMSFAGLNAVALADGPLTLTATITPSGGNPASYLGTPPAKDTVAPVAPTSLQVAQGPTNPAHGINASSTSAVMLDIVWPAGTDAAAQATVSLTAGGITVSSAPFQPSPSASQSTGPIDATPLQDGPVSVQLTVTDTAGNSTVFSGAPAFKDTVAPSAAVGASVAPGPQNVAGIVNTGNVGSCFIDVILGGASVSSDTITCTLTDGVVSVTTPASPGLSGGGVITLGPVDLTTLQDGSIPLQVTVTDGLGNSTVSAGAPATKDTAPPAAASTAFVAAGLSNPADIINVSNQTNVSIDVVLAGGAPGDVVRVRLDDGAMTIQSGLLPAPSGGGIVTFGGLDATGLQDGALNLSVDIIDGAGNTTTAPGHAVTKDVVPPASPTATFLPSTATNPSNVVNLANVNGPVFQVTLPASYGGSETVTLIVTDGVGPILLSTATSAPAGGGVLSILGPDLSALADGSLGLVVSVTDPAGNDVLTNGSALLKDTVAPAPPILLQVAAGPSNLTSRINQFSESAVMLDIQWDVSLDGSETALVTLTDSTGAQIALAPLAPPPGGGAAVLGPIDVQGLADGAIDLSVSLSDPSGNITVFQGTQAQKDSTAPLPPTSVHVVPGATNPVDFVNAANETSAEVQVVYGPSSSSSDVVLLEISDGTTVLTFGPVAAPSGAGTVSFSALDLSPLLDGALTLAVTTTDPQGNGVPQAGTPAFKDTLAPSSPTTAFISAGATNPQSAINGASISMVQVDVVLPSSYDGSEEVVAILTDSSMTSAQSAPTPAPSGGGSLSVGPVDATSLLEGNISVSLVINDPAGNVTTYAGLPGVLDVTPPAPPLSLRVAAGASNAVDVVNGTSVASVMIDVFWDASMMGTESAQIDFATGGSPVVQGPFSAPAGGGSQTLGPFDLTALSDGALSLVLTLTDAYGNPVTFTGTPAVMDTTAPAAAISGQVPGGSGSGQPAGYINTATANGVTIDVVLPTGADANDSVRVLLSDGSATVGSTPLPSITGGGTLSFGPVDASSLSDGTIVISVEVTDASGNVTNSQVGSAIKDTAPPAAPLSSVIAMTAANPQGFVNAATESAFTVALTLPSSYSGGEVATVLISDGAGNQVASPPISIPPGGGLVTSSGLNGATLIEGSLTLQVDVTDAAGNTSSSSGSPGVKDVTPPLPPSLLRVAAGASNAVDFVNSNNESNVVFDVLWDATMDGTESADFTLTDAGSQVATLAANSPQAGGGAATVAGLDASLLSDGGLTLALTLTDLAGNATNFSGNAATKDATGPSLPLAAFVVAGAGNPANGINLTNTSSVSVQVDLDAGSVATDQVSVILSDGSGSITSSSQSGTSGPGTLIFSGLDATSLSDGLISIQVVLLDVNDNQVLYTGTTATKSSSAPAAPTSAHVAATSQNPIDFVNLATCASVAVDVVFPNSYVGTESFSVQLNDGVNPPVTSASSAIPAGGGLVTVSGIDASSLADGSLMLDVIVIDAAANGANYSGSQATKDTAPPAAALTGNVAMGAQNAQSVVNSHNVTATVVEISLAGSSLSTDSVQFALSSDAGGSVTSPAAAAPAGGGAFTFPALDVSALNDGNLTLTVTVTDQAGNPTSTSGTPAILDTQGPDAPLSAHVTAGPSNALDVINPTNEASVSIEVTLDTGSLSGDVLQATLSDGQGTSVLSGVLNPPGGAATITFTGIDTTSLADGTLTLEVTLTDSFQNTSSFTGTPVLKDTGPPSAPTSFRVTATGQNPADFINIATQAAATLSAVFPGSYDGTETATVTVSDGVNPDVVLAATPVPAGGGTVNFPAADASALNDGSIILSMTVVDGGGNTATFAGTPATKDTVAPDLVSASIPTAASHPADTISPFSVGSVLVVSVWGAAADGTETATAQFSDGSTTVTGTSVAAPAGGGAVNHAPVDLAGLADGSLTMTVTATDVAGNPSVVTIGVAKHANLAYSRYAFVSNQLDDTITAYQLDVTSGTPRANGFSPSGGNPAHLLVDATGNRVYVAETGLNQVGLYSIQHPRGSLVAGTPASTGISPVRLATDPDGKFLYTADSGSNQISVCLINPVDGSLSAGSPVGAGTNPVDIAVDPTGKFLLAINQGSNDLWVYAVDGATGALNNIVTAPTGTTPSAVAVHPSGLYVYVANTASADISVFGFDPSNGALTALATATAPAGVDSLAVSGDGTYLYAAASSTNGLQAFSIDFSTGNVSAVGSVLATPAQPSGLAVDAAVNHVYLVAEGDNQLVSYDIGPGGALTLGATAITQASPSAIALGNGANPLGFVLKFAYVVNKASGDVATHDVDDTTGLIMPFGSPVSVGTDPVHLALHPDGNRMYVVNQVSETIHQFSIDAASGALAVVGSPVSTGQNPSAIVVDPSGRFAYAVNSDDDTISLYAIDPSTGSLTATGSPTATLVAPVAAAIHPNGKFLYVIHQGSDNVQSYAIDPASGALSAVGAPVTAGVIPIWIAIHPTGKWVYVVNRGTSDVYVYDADPTTGALTFSSITTTGSQPFGMAVEPFGNYAYVVNRTAGDVRAFSIDATTGALAQVGSALPVGGDSRAIAVDPRSDFVYVTDFNASGVGSVRIFVIDDNTGQLTSAGSPQTISGMGSIALALVADVL